MTHLCLTSPDLDATEAHLKSVGIPLSRPRNPKRGVDGNRGMWIEDPDGNRIEIMEMAPNCIQYQAVKNLQAGKAPQALTLF
jgi:lactoylglutathione lyase